MDKLLGRFLESEPRWRIGCLLPRLLDELATTPKPRSAGRSNARWGSLPGPRARKSRRPYSPPGRRSPPAGAESSCDERVLCLMRQRQAPDGTPRGTTVLRISSSAGPSKQMRHWRSIRLLIGRVGHHPRIPSGDSGGSSTHGVSGWPPESGTCDRYDFRILRSEEFAFRLQDRLCVWRDSWLSRSSNRAAVS